MEATAIEYVLKKTRRRGRIEVVRWYLASKIVVIGNKLTMIGRWTRGGKVHLVRDRIVTSKFEAAAVVASVVELNTLRSLVVLRW